MPNNNDDVKVEHHWQQYRVSVAQLERENATRLPFFDHLPQHVREALRNRVDDEIIPPPPPRQFTPRNYGDKPIDHTQYTVLERGLRGTVKSYSRDKKYGFIQIPGRPDVFVHASGRITSLNADEPVTFDLVRGLDEKVFAVAVESHSPRAVEEPGARERFAEQSSNKP
jgi:cold shock CspA family protein